MLYFSFLFIFNGYWEKKKDNFKDFNINFISAMFLSNDKKIQGPQKQVGGQHAAHGPQFGHAWYNRYLISSPFCMQCENECRNGMCNQPLGLYKISNTCLWYFDKKAFLQVCMQVLCQYFRAITFTKYIFNLKLSKYHDQKIFLVCHRT